VYQAFLALLVLAWTVYLGSSFLSRRAETNSGSSISSFNRQLHVMGGTPKGHERGLRSAEANPLPVPPWATPVSLSDAHQRRIEVIFTLLGGAATALVLGILITRWSLLLHVAIDITLIGYLFMLARSQQLAAERHEKVTHLGERRPGRFKIDFDQESEDYDNEDIAHLPVAVGASDGSHGLTRRSIEPNPGFRVLGG